MKHVDLGRTEKMQDLVTTGVNILSMDVTDDESMAEGIKAIVASEGRIDVLINNAGFGSYGAIEEVSTQDARYQLEVNVFGAARQSGCGDSLHHSSEITRE